MNTYIDILALVAALTGRLISSRNELHWFRGSRDRVTVIIPKRLIDLWQDGKAPKLANYTGI